MKLSTTAAFRLQASITVALLAGSIAPTPLYPHYQAAWAFSTITTTLVFGVYSAAVLAALLTTGRLSDHIGRRPVLIASTLLSALAMGVLGTAGGEAALYAGRLLQGVATGAAVSAVGAGLVDLDRTRGPVANALAPISGTGLGALFAGLVIHYLPYPTHLVYALLGAVFVAQAVGVAFLPERIATMPGALASLRPRLALPASVYAPMRVALPVLIAAWALAGFYASLGPALVQSVFDFDASLFGGVALFAMAGSGAVAVLVLMSRGTRTMLAAGATGLVVGATIVLVALATRAPGLFFGGTAVAGMGFGASFQGAIRSALPLAAAHERAGVLSVIFVVAYASMALPSLGAGIAVAADTSLVRTAEGFSAFVFVLAAIAVFAIATPRRSIAACVGEQP